MSVHRVKGWDEFFESAKSRTYKHKSQAFMPNKHGLGYRRILSHKDGPAMFGAWCAMVQVLSRQYPRQGYCTDTGTPEGSPWTASDVSLVTSMPESVCERMLSVCASEGVAWLEVVGARIPQGYHKDTIVEREGVSEGEGKGKGKGEGKGEESGGAFGEFWKSWPAHPRKTNKAGCLKHWTAEGLDECADAIKAGLDAWKASDAWVKDGGQFIPLPATWLHQRRWEDLEAAHATAPSASRRTPVAGQGAILKLAKAEEY